MPYVRLKTGLILLRVVVILSLLGACASGGTGTGAAGSRQTPPRMIGRSPLELSGEMDLTIQVSIRPDGAPDLQTLRVTGKGSTTARDAVLRWIAGSSFQPARRDGIPVEGIFRTRLRTRVTTRRL